jgi:hypothetical protein
MREKVKSERGQGYGLNRDKKMALKNTTRK